MGRIDVISGDSRDSAANIGRPGPVPARLAKGSAKTASSGTSPTIIT
jgi:hypothetical protein